MKEDTPKAGLIPRDTGRQRFKGEERTMHEMH